MKTKKLKCLCMDCQEVFDSSNDFAAHEASRECDSVPAPLALDGDFALHPITMKFERWVIRNMQAERKDGGLSQARQAQGALIRDNGWRRPTAEELYKDE